MSKTQNEPLLAENPNRYVMFPLQDQDIWQELQENDGLLLASRRN